MNTDKISFWHNFHQCTISVENTNEVECDVGLDVHANGLHHDSMINIEMRIFLDKILTDVQFSWETQCGIIVWLFVPTDFTTRFSDWHRDENSLW